MTEKSRLDRLIWMAKNNWVIASLGLVVITTITLAQFGDSIVRLWKLQLSEGEVILDLTVQKEPVPLDHIAPPRTGVPSSLAPRHLVPPILDIKVVNNTDRTLFLDNVRILAIRTFLEEPSKICMGVMFVPTGFYDVGLDLGEKTQGQEISISQALKPKEADRFFISLAPSEESTGGRAEFRISVVVEGLAAFTSPLKPISVSLNKVPGTCGGPVKRQLNDPPQKEKTFEPTH